ncbi:MAG TPA: DUF86 domain-containing protein [Candidatus Sulfomarinibacteraceae bacterium]|nr:DUF86 domain-containing protein [Candidatus Sulfomarinibacteraceae bacterium]
MTNEFLDYVEDMIENMEKAELLVQDVDFEQFETDFRINYAVVRALEIVGEATKRLPMELREQYPDVPWREMAGMRDRIVHGYDIVDLRIVWRTVQERIPQVKPQLKQMLADFER